MRLETEFFPQNLVSFYHNSAGCAVHALQIVLFKQVLNLIIQSLDGRDREVAPTKVRRLIASTEISLYMNGIFTNL